MQRKPYFFLLVLLAPVLPALFFLAGAGPARAGLLRPPTLPLPQWGPDIQVNYFMLKRPTFAFERNPMLAVRPTDPR